MPRKRAVWSEVGTPKAFGSTSGLGAFTQVDIAAGSIASDINVIAVAWTNASNRRVQIVLLDAETYVPIPTSTASYSFDPLAVFGNSVCPRLMWLGSDLYAVLAVPGLTSLTLNKLTTSTMVWTVVGTLTADCRVDAADVRAWYDVHPLTTSTFVLAWQTTSNSIDVAIMNTSALATGEVASSESAGAVDAIAVHATTGESIWVTYIVNATNQTRITNIDEATLAERAGFPCDGPSAAIGASNITSGVVRTSATTALCVFSGQFAGPTFTQACTCDTDAALSTWRANAPYAMLSAKPFVAGGRWFVPVVAGANGQSTVVPWANTAAQWSARVLEVIQAPPSDGATFASQFDWAMMPNSTTIPLTATGYAQHWANGADNLFVPSSVAALGTTLLYVWPEVFGLANGAVRESLCVISHDTSKSSHLRGAELGQATFLSGLAVDSTYAFEHGFADRPEVLTSANGSTGAVADGTYQYRAVWAWASKLGQIVRSAPSNALEHKVTAGPNAVTITVPIPTSSMAYAPHLWEGARAWCEVYRTEDTSDGPYYLVASAQFAQPDDSPTATVDVSDTFADASITAFPTLYTGDVGTQRARVANAGAPTFVSTASVKGRIWGLWPDRRTVSFTSELVPFEMPHCHNEFTFTIDDDVVALAALDESIVAFSSRAIYAMQGDGPSDRYPGSDSDYRGFRRIASDVGCIDATSVALTSDGLVFRSQHGLSVLGRGGQVTDFGREVTDELADYDDDTTASVHPKRRWLYVACSNASDGDGIRLVYDYANKAWSKDLVTASQAGARMLGQLAHSDGSIYFIDASTGYVFKENVDGGVHTDVGEWVTSSVQLAPFKSAGPQGSQGVDSFYLLASKATSCALTLDVTHNHGWGSSTTESKTITSAEIDAFVTLPIVQIRRSFTLREGQAVTVTITDAAPSTSTGSGEGLTWIAYGFDHTPKKQPMPLPAAQQR
jgi:hypothetical protein